MVWETHSPGQGLTQSAIIITSSDIGEYLIELIGVVLGFRWEERQDSHLIPH